jgi:hypothetical protein
MLGTLKKTVPKLAEFVVNERYLDPGAAHPAVPIFQLPAYCASHEQKPSFLEEVARILGRSAETELPTIRCHSSPTATAGDLLDQLQEVEAEEEQLRKKRQSLLQQLRDTKQIEEENRRLRDRNTFLEREVLHLRGPHRQPLSVYVGDLERISTTRGLLLYPHLGTTTVYPLDKSDYAKLQLTERDPCLSCEPL